MTKRDFHIHSTFSDGKCTPEELVLAAIEKGMSHIGLSDHSYTPFDTDYCMSPEKYEDYKAEAVRLRKKYGDKIKIYCGIEQDFYSAFPAEGFDYIIGSVHYVKKDGEYLPVDKSTADLRDAVEKHFGGDPIAFCEEYFRCVGEVVERTGACIVGHFDLVSKFNEKDPFIDENDPRYVFAWKAAVDKLIPYGVYFEINTGVIPRGYKSVPYPSAPIMEYIKEKGGKFIMSSDSHRPTLCYGFDKYLPE